MARNCMVLLRWAVPAHKETTYKAPNSFQLNRVALLLPIIEVEECFISMFKQLVDGDNLINNK